MVKALKASDGAIAYVSYHCVLSDQLAEIRLRNVANQSVSASAAGFRAAILDNEMSRKGDGHASLMNRPSPAAWPSTLTSFVLFDAEPLDSERACATMTFIYWCFMHGDELTRGTEFAPLPINLQARLAARFEQVTPKDGLAPRYRAY